MKMKNNKPIQKINQLPGWIAGLAAASAGVSHGAVVQIDLVNNVLASASEGGDSSFNVNFTGAVGFSFSDIFFRGATSSVGLQGFGYGNTVRLSSSDLSTRANAAVRPGGFVASVDGVVASGPGPQDITGLIAITFINSTINGGAATDGFVQARAYNLDADSHFVEFQRIVFDDASTSEPLGVVSGGSNTLIGSVENGVFTAVPEPSSLALLALGAGGVILRRQRKQSA